MGFTIDYFYSLNERQFVNILKGYSKKREEEVLQSKENWERVRWQTHIMVQIAPYLEKEERKEIFETLKFPWDKEILIEEKKGKTTAEMKASFNNIS